MDCIWPGLISRQRYNMIIGSSHMIGPINSNTDGCHIYKSFRKEKQTAGRIKLKLTLLTHTKVRSQRRIESTAKPKLKAEIKIS